MKEITKLLLQFFMEDPKFVLTNVMFSLLIPIQDVVLPHLYGNVISAIENKKSLLKPLLIVIIILSIVQIGYLISDWHDNKLFPKLQAYIRKKMLESVFNNFETQYQDLSLGDIMSKFIKIPAYLTEWFERCKNYIAPYIIAYIVATLYFIYNDLTLGIGLGILLCIYLYIVIGAPIFCKNRAIIKDNTQNELHEEIDDTLRNLISVYGGDQQDNEIIRLNTYEDKYALAYEHTINYALITRICITPLVISFLILFFYQCNKRLKSGKMPAARFVPLFIILLYILNSMMILTDQVRDMIFEIGIISNFEDMFSYKKTIKNDNNIPNNLVILHGIHMYNITFTYSDNTRPILKNFNLSIKPGERIGIIGEIGSGKSTVLKILLKLHEATSGEIFLNKISYSKISVRDIRKRIGYVPQQPTLFNRTILENIKYSNKHITNNDIIELLNNLGLENEFSHLENGLNTKIGKNGSKISGGQRQLVWSLRILLHDPEILILDEPTASLDEKTKQLMIRLYDHFMINKTIIMVTHDNTLMKYANRIITMHKGEIVNDYYIKSEKYVN